MTEPLAPSGPLPLTALLERPQRLVAGALVLLTLLAWVELLGGSGAAPHAHHAGALLAPAAHAWGPREAGAALLMWVLMAVAMMLPAAAPAILSFAAITRRGTTTGTAVGSVSAFVTGYLGAWWGFGAVATLIQWGLATAAGHAPALAAAGPRLGGALLIGAGLYQFSALKHRCLTQCRSPLTFFLAHWRDGSRGAALMGLRHGLHCVGCCWALMALMLVAGAMNVAWTAALTALMLAEKVLPGGVRIGRVVGVGLIAWGGALLASA